MAVLNKHKDVIPKDAVFIGRPSIWGNPFVIGKHGDRDQVIVAYATWLKRQLINEMISLEQLAQLHGKDLVCFCAPQRCHGDFLTRIAAWAHGQPSEEPQP